MDSSDLTLRQVRAGDPTESHSPAPGVKAPWVDPVIERMPVAKTQNVSGIGPDGNFFPDCTHS